MSDYDELFQWELERDFDEMMDAERRCVGHHLVNVVVAVEVPEHITPGMAVRSITDLLQDRAQSRSGVVFSPNDPQAYMSWVASDDTEGGEA